VRDRGRAEGGNDDAQFDANAPETREAFTEIAQFFDRHLGK
jgi:hypothetical protein